MKPANATTPKRWSSKNGPGASSSTILVERMKERNMFFRSSVHLDPDRIEKLNRYMKKHNHEMRAFALAELIEAYRSKFGDSAAPGEVIERLADFEPKEHGKISVFLTDKDFHFVQLISRNSGLRKSASRGIAILIDVLC